MARNVPQGCYELIEGGVYARPTNTLYPGLGLASLRHTLVDLLLGLADERVEEVVQRIFANRLEFVGVRRRVARLGAVVIVTFPRGSGTRRPLRLALRYASIAGCCLGSNTGIDMPCTRARLHAVGGKGLGYRLLRHDGSIDGCAGGGGDDLGAQRACGGRVDEAGVPRVLDAVYDGSVAIVGIGTRRFAFERLEGAVGARITAGSFDGRCLRARGNSSGRGSQRTPAGLAGLTRGRRGAVYMVRHIPSSWSSL